MKYYIEGVEHISPYNDRIVDETIEAEELHLAVSKFYKVYPEATIVCISKVRVE